MAKLKRWGLVVATLLALAVGCGPSKKQRAFRELQVLREQIYQGRDESVAEQRPAGELPAEPGLADYLAYAEAHNPQLQAALKRYEAALKRVQPARTLPDPNFTYRYFFQEVETRVGSQEQGFGLAQKFPWFGKLQLRGDIALEKALAQRQAFEATRLKLFYQLKQAYYEYYYLERAIAVTKDNITWMNYLEKVARTKYKVAAAGHPQIIRAQVEQGELEDRLRALEDLRNPIVAKLNAALNRPTAAMLPWPKGPLKKTKLEANDQQILSWLREGNPTLKGLAHEIAAQKQTIRLAGKDYFPDITLGVDYIATSEALMSNISDSGKDPVVVKASVNLPIWRKKYRDKQRQARARHQAALQMRLGQENTLYADAQMALFKLRDAGQKIGLYQTLILKTNQALKATITAFKADKADFFDLIDEVRILLRFELSYQRALADQAQRLAELEMLIGRELPGKSGETKVLEIGPQDE